MNAQTRFEPYIEHPAGGLGHSDRHAGLKAYCTGLMLPLTRKSVEPPVSTRFMPAPDIRH
jgi:SRSO17 transposase